MSRATTHDLIEDRREALAAEGRFAETLIEAMALVVVLAVSAILASAVLRSVADQGGGNDTTSCEAYAGQ